MGCQFQMEVCRHMIDSQFKMFIPEHNHGLMNYECMHYISMMNQLIDKITVQILRDRIFYNTLLPLTRRCPTSVLSFLCFLGR